MRRRDFVKLAGVVLAATPSVARVQGAKKIPTVAYLWHAGGPKEEAPYYEAVIEGFSKLGYVDGRDFRLLHRYPNETPELFRSMAAELVAMTLIMAADGYGLPVSTTHVLSSGVAGTMAANGSGVQMETVRNLALAWILTLPVCVFLGAATFAAGLYIVFALGLR